MARKQLINLHSTVVKNPSASTIEPQIAVGEIVVQAVKSAPVIYTKVYDSTKEGAAAYSFAEFIDKAKVETLIAGVSSDVTELSGNVGTLSSETKTLESHFEAAVSGIGYSANSIANYIDAQQFAKDADLQSLSGTVTDALVGLTIDSQHSVKSYVDGKVKSEEDARKNSDTELENSITALSQNYGYAVDGLTIDNTHSVKSYVDAQVSQAITSVYKVKGSVSSYTDLLAITGQVEGDVWNVQQAVDIQNPEQHYPAGTNFVWVDGEQEQAGHWDALGGSIDLSPYALNSALQEEISARTSADAEINGKIGGSFDSTNTVASAITSARTSADHSLKSITGTGSDYLTVTIDAVTGELGHKSQKFSAVPVVADNLADVQEGQKKLADALDVKNKLSNINTDITALENAFTSETAYTSTELAKVLTGITGDSKNKYADLNVKAWNNHSQEVELELKVAGDISAVATSGQLADARFVQLYVDGEIEKEQIARAAVASDLADLKADFTAETAFTSTELAKVLTGISAEGKNVYVEASATTKTDKTQTVEVKAIVAGPLSSMTASSGQLADAYFVKNYIDKKVEDEATERLAVASDLADLKSDFIAETAKTEAAINIMLTGVTGSGDDYITVSPSKSGKNGVIDVTADVASVFSGVSETGKLADALQVKNYVDKNVQDEASERLAVASDLADLKSDFIAETAYTSTEFGKVLTGVSASGDEYITAQASQRNNNAQSITILADVAGALGSISATGKLADAKYVQDYVDDKYNDATGKTDTVASDLAELQDIVGDNSGYTSAYTITAALASLEADAVRSVSVYDTEHNGITATENPNTHEVVLNFDEMVVDCGEY